MRAELLAAEAEAREKKRKAEGLPLEAPSSKAIEGSSKGKGKEVENEGSDEESNKRRKLLQEAIALDKDDDDSDEDKDDDEDDRYDLAGPPRVLRVTTNCFFTATKMTRRMTLLSSCVSWKRSREKELKKRPDRYDLICPAHRRELPFKWIFCEIQEQEQNAKSQRDREEEIALGNPLLNLAAALGQSTPGGASVASTTGGFTVKKRWDDGTSPCQAERLRIVGLTFLRPHCLSTTDLIFKNQAMGSNDKQSGQFVNDLLRTEFHKYVFSHCSCLSRFFSGPRDLSFFRSASAELHPLCSASHLRD